MENNIFGRPRIYFIYICFAFGNIENKFVYTTFFTTFVYLFSEMHFNCSYGINVVMFLFSFALDNLLV